MTEDNSLGEELRAIIAERDALRQENIRLIQLLGGNQVLKETGSALADQVKPEITLADSMSILTPEDKVKLFRSLFRGRDDVYAIRWDGRNGKSGYSPARRFRPQNAQGKTARIDPVDLLPLTDAVVRDHLGVLTAMFKKRLAGYKALGYKHTEVNSEVGSTNVMPLWK